jgi:ribonuclease HI
MELHAAIAALECIKTPCEIEFFTDSEYLKDGISKNIAIWKAHGWRRGTKIVKNEDLWRRLDCEANRHRISWNWLRGHAGHPINERCDELARTAIANVRRQFAPAELQRLLTEFQRRRAEVAGQGQLL